VGAWGAAETAGSLHAQTKAIQRRGLAVPLSAPLPVRKRDQSETAQSYEQRAVSGALASAWSAGSRRSQASGRSADSCVAVRYSRCLQPNPQRPSRVSRADECRPPIPSG
jgi:hypothetical protein